jgi:hypothetical protein
MKTERQRLSFGRIFHAELQQIAPALFCSRLVVHDPKLALSSCRGGASVLDRSSKEIETWL